MTRDPQWQAMMRGKSLAERLAFAAQARAASKARSGTLSDDITDVNADAIVAALREAGVSVMLHGHTHRPAVHKIMVDGQPAQRIVLGDWYKHGSVVRWNDDGPVLSTMERQSGRNA
jgi:UDP-2,3-diacylglucosamine hydrolase